MNCLYLIFIANSWGTEDTRSRINLTSSTFSRLQSCLWSWREISLRTKGRVYQAVVRSILFYGCKMSPARVADERVLAFFDNNSIRRILNVRRRDCVPTTVLWRSLCFTSKPAQLIQRRPRCFSHVAIGSDGELTNYRPFPTPPRT